MQCNIDGLIFYKRSMSMHM